MALELFDETSSTQVQVTFDVTTKSAEILINGVGVVGVRRLTFFRNEDGETEMILETENTDGDGMKHLTTVLAREDLPWEASQYMVEDAVEEITGVKEDDKVDEPFLPWRAGKYIVESDICIDAEVELEPEPKDDIIDWKMAKYLDLTSPANMSSKKETISENV